MAKKSKAEAAKSNVSPDDEAACFTEYSDLRGESARIGQRIGSMLERYKKMGVDTKSIKANYALSQKEDATEILMAQVEQAKRLAIIEWDEDGQSSFDRGLEIGSMSPESARMISRGRAKAAGYKAGNTGTSTNANPHQPGTEEHVLWLEQFHAGHAQRVADGKGDVVKASPRSRKKASEVPTDATIN